ncbi:MAG: serine--tRNA ligase [Candidatus Paraimprobicoccus trichonymphae]|uniref:Serine--tRNA ligase n=1 Tax=Candidatus Paraimprobicoccus trichonymphae TaxID=3033793 RepID=A0AA48I539_9FIRM|nr:MAG: serine--tRNA ligase [Candidatus Paraimprobicoccus trichonymphae]
MLDIKIVRENPERIKEMVKLKKVNANFEIEDLLKIDVERRNLTNKIGIMQSERNDFNKKIFEIKKSGEDLSKTMLKMKNLSDKISSFKSELSELEIKQKNILLSIPNLPHESVPIGLSDKENLEIRKVGNVRKFDFKIKSHWEIGKNLDILDFERGSKVSGSRFCFYKNLGAKLERAIINFFLDTHTENGYSEIFPPFIVNKDSMFGTGQLPKFEEDMFKLENLNYFLIPTAEVPVTNLHRNEILSSNKLPLKYCAYSACFRAEAGSAGKDTRGLIRMHQFNKVELVKLCKPENSYEELELLTQDAEKVLKLLALPYRVVSLCTGDLSFCSAKTYDIEVWMPSYSKYVEISSCSNFESYQARRMSIKYKNNLKEKAQLVHTLNGSGVAVGRTVAAILENYQKPNGTFEIPEILKKYM